MTTNRSKPLYPTEGPGDGRTWHEFFEDLRKPVEDPADPVDGGDDLAGAIVITLPATEVPDGQPIPRALATWRNRLLANDWTFKVGHSVAHHNISYHLNGNVKAPEHDEHQWWINAKNGNSYITISYNIVDGASKPNRTVLRVHGSPRNPSAKELQEFIES